MGYPGRSALCSIYPLQYWVISLPHKGTLYQYDNGSRGAGTSTAPAQVTDSDYQVVFAPPAGDTGDPYTNFAYRVNDDPVHSNIATATIVVGTVDVYLPITLKE